MRCVSGFQCPLILQQCQWSGALRKVLPRVTQELSSSDVSSIPSNQALVCDQLDPLNWVVVRILLPADDMLGHNILDTCILAWYTTRDQQRLYTNRHCSAANYLIWSEFMFSKAGTVNSQQNQRQYLSQGSPVVFASSETLRLRSRSLRGFP